MANHHSLYMYRLLSSIYALCYHVDVHNIKRHRRICSKGCQRKFIYKENNYKSLNWYVGIKEELHSFCVHSSGVRFTTRCRALTAGLSLTLNLTTNSTIPVSQPLSCVSLSRANLSLSLTSQISQWSSSIETTSSDHECKQEAAGA